MNNLVKRVLAIVLSAVVCIGAVVTPISTAFADEAHPALQAEKKAEETDREKYEVSIQVPGGDAEVRHDEIILMVDGSYSMDNEWPAMKAAIIEIGKNVLDGSGHTMLTLMAFGMGDNMVLEHVVTVDELAAELGELPGNLLYGRSSTNCEAGFTGVAEYIEAHDDTLGDVQVVFISDGNINTDEHKEVFYFAETAWTKTFTLGGALTAALEDSVKVMKAYEEVVPSPAFVDVFGADADLDELLADIDEIVLARHTKYKIPISVDTDTEMYEKIVKWADKVYRNVFAAAGLDVMGENCVSDVERAFVTYDNENITYIQETFYYVLMGRGYPDRFTRTPAAADALAAMDKVEALYLVDYDTASTWMSVDVKSEKAHFVNSNGISGLIEALKDTLNALAKTPYNDVVITDYMSKWVKLDPTTLRIVDVTSDKVIWTVKDGWLIDSGRPTAKEIPVTVELVDPENYAAGGADVIGNTSGDIYLLTWYVKDGAMLRSDNYRLAYDVDVDVEEDGFEYNKFYPANGTTENTYKDETGAEKKVPIKVPEVVSEIESTQIQIDGNKYLDGEAPADAQFSFELWFEEKCIETVVNDAEGKFTFSAIECDALGTYVYTVKEVIGDDAKIVYDESIYTVTVVVTTDGVEFIADAAITLGEDECEMIEFYNATTEEIPEEDPPLGSTAETVWTIFLVIAMLGIVMTSMKKRAIQ